MHESNGKINKSENSDSGDSDEILRLIDNYPMITISVIIFC